ncbi:MAG: hypothetical protein ACREMY_24565, partial [bacterium]
MPDTGALLTNVRVEHLDIGQRDIANAIDRLTSIGTALTAEGGDSIAYFFDPKLGVIDARGTIDSTKVYTVLGDLGKFVSYTPNVSVVPASRNWTSAPFPGGARAKRVGSTNAWDCTTGFTVHKTSNGLNYLVTAGHCGALSTSWISPGSGYTIGSMQYRYFGPRDVGLLGGQSYAAAIYTGDATGVLSTVKGASNPVTDRSIYCYSGGASYDNCTVTVSSLSANECYDGACMTNLMAFEQFGSCPVMPGDSGAPFYLDFAYGGYPYIRGMVTAFTSDHST